MGTPKQLLDLQARYDKNLRERLAKDSGVERALEKLEERSSGFGFHMRRSLLAGALRLRPNMVPTVTRALNQCREALDFDDPVEVFVKSMPVVNAFCAKDPAGRIAIGLSSELVERFTPEELTFVIGHELGHIVYDHFGIPMPHVAMMEDMAGRIVSRPTALDLYLWARAAELSADRVGLLCISDPSAAASGFFKLASGLSSEHIQVDLDALADQVDSMASAPAARADPRDVVDDSLDCFSTHPYNPLRLRALSAFRRSQAYYDATGQAREGMTTDELEAIVDRDMAMMEPTYLQEKSASSDLMRDLLLAAGLFVAKANDEVVPQEIDALRAMLGADSVHQRIDVDQTIAGLDKAVERVKDAVPVVERMRLVQHLTIIAAADGNVDDRELAAMFHVAAQLEVPTTLIDETLRGAAHPMD
ncbi:MAG: M48 family metallopeptidase [Deltaproteobacteria bacterium]